MIWCHLEQRASAIIASMISSPEAGNLGLPIELHLAFGVIVGTDQCYAARRSGLAARAGEGRRARGLAFMSSSQMPGAMTTAFGPAPLFNIPHLRRSHRPMT